MKLLPDNSIDSVFAYIAPPFCDDEQSSKLQLVIVIEAWLARLKHDPLPVDEIDVKLHPSTSALQDNTKAELPSVDSKPANLL